MPRSLMNDSERAYWATSPHPATHAASIKFFKERRDREKLKQELKREILEELRAEDM